MSSTMRQYFVWGTVIVAIVAGIALLGYARFRPSQLDSFAQCLGEKGATFYGAFWCPHCQEQKHLFGRSARLLPYTECSTPDGNGQLSVCKDKGVSSYPTWDFSDGTRETGVLTLDDLATKTSCELPKGQ